MPLSYKEWSNKAAKGLLSAAAQRTELGLHAHPLRQGLKHRITLPPLHLTQQLCSEAKLYLGLAILITVAVRVHLAPLIIVNVTCLADAGGIRLLESSVQPVAGTAGCTLEKSSSGMLTNTPVTCTLSHEVG